jgi:trehalose-phosphatase
MHLNRINPAELAAAVKRSNCNSLLLDYDGTLVPIKALPAEARPTDQIKALLSGLVQKILVGIVSGRCLAELKKLLPLKDIILVGCHGAEIQTSDKVLLRPPEQGKENEIVKKLWLKIEPEISSIHGITLENKIVSLALHYRNAGAAEAELAVNTFKALTGAYVENRLFRWLEGKKVLEFLPAQTNKGKAVEFLLQHFGLSKARTAYIGDDQTDETAFRVLHSSAITVVVGSRKKNSSARFCLRSPAEVVDFLEILQNIS